MSKLVHYVSVTQDGFIAGSDEEFGFFVQNEDFTKSLNARYPEIVLIR